MDGLNKCEHATVVCSFFMRRELEVHLEVKKFEWIDTIDFGVRE